jgi:hypothetical protein
MGDCIIVGDLESWEGATWRVLVERNVKLFDKYTYVKLFDKYTYAA